MADNRETWLRQRPRLDLALGIDLTGPLDDVAPRRTFARHVINAVARTVAYPDELRIAVIGYWDYDHLAGRRSEAPVEVSDFAPTESALGAVARLEHRDAMQDVATAVEDALLAMGTLAWRPENRSRVILLLGFQPPHPKAPTCRGWQQPNPADPHRDWRTIVEDLDNRLGARRLAVIGPAPPRFGGPNAGEVGDYAVFIHI